MNGLTPLRSDGLFCDEASAALVDRIAAALEIPVAVFMPQGASRSPPTGGDDRETVLELFSALTDLADRRLFVEMARAFVTLVRERQATHPPRDPGRGSGHSS